jgi:serine/threonine protein phosphatase PrpC
MRNYVECCLGGEATLPEMTISCRQALEDGDVLLVCSDGIWANLKDAEIASFWKPGNGSCRDALEALADHAVAASAPHSDNASAASLVWRH